MPTTRIHRILERSALAFVGVFDTLSAKLAEQVGFPMAFVRAILSARRISVSRIWAC